MTCLRATFATWAILLGAAAPCSAAEPPASAPSSQPTTRPAEDFVRQMLRGESGKTDPMSAAIEAMDVAGRRLGDDKDCGPLTREAQRRALTRLDEAIEQVRRGESPPSAQRAGRSADRRPAGRPNTRRNPPKPSAGSPDADRAGPDRSGRSGQDRSRVGLSPDELQRRWGFLPDRDREELLQGLDEQFPAKYRECIERYYRSLAEEAPKP